eukprot:767405-Hanusia_phi.AAC.2
MERDGAETYGGACEADLVRHPHLRLREDLADALRDIGKALHHFYILPPPHSPPALTPSSAAPVHLPPPPSRPILAPSPSHRLPGCEGFMFQRPSSEPTWRSPRACKASMPGACRVHRAARGRRRREWGASEEAANECVRAISLLLPRTQGEDENWKEGADVCWGQSSMVRYTPACWRPARGLWASCLALCERRWVRGEAAALSLTGRKQGTNWPPLHHIVYQTMRSARYPTVRGGCVAFMKVAQSSGKLVLSSGHANEAFLVPAGGGGGGGVWRAKRRERRGGSYRETLCDSRVAHRCTSINSSRPPARQS